MRWTTTSRIETGHGYSTTNINQEEEIEQEVTEENGEEHVPILCFLLFKLLSFGMKGDRCWLALLDSPHGQDLRQTQVKMPVSLRLCATEFLRLISGRFLQGFKTAKAQREVGSRRPHRIISTT